MSYSTAKIVQVTTADAMTADEWRHAWELAAPVVVAAGRFLDAEEEGDPLLLKDAHFQLLAALTEYIYEAQRDPDEPSDGYDLRGGLLP